MKNQLPPGGDVNFIFLADLIQSIRRFPLLPPILQPMNVIRLYRVHKHLSHFLSFAFVYRGPNEIGNL